VQNWHLAARTRRGLLKFFSTAPYEFGATAFPLSPVYVRGEAYLAAHQRGQAAIEFQEISLISGRNGFMIIKHAVANSTASPMWIAASIVRLR